MQVVLHLLKNQPADSTVVMDGSDYRRVNLLIMPMGGGVEVCRPTCWKLALWSQWIAAVNAGNYRYLWLPAPLSAGVYKSWGPRWPHCPLAGA